MAPYIVPLSGILMGVLVLGLIFNVVTHKGNSHSSSTSKVPWQSHIERPHISGACFAVLHCATDRQELLRRRGDRGFSLKTLLCPPQITLEGENYTGKTPLPYLLLKDAVLHDWNCQIKHTVSKQVFTKTETFLMEMIDRLFTEKSQFS